MVLKAMPPPKLVKNSGYVRTHAYLIQNKRLPQLYLELPDSNVGSELVCSEGGNKRTQVWSICHLDAEKYFFKNYQWGRSAKCDFPFQKGFFVVAGAETQSWKIETIECADGGESSYTIGLADGKLKLYWGLSDVGDSDLRKVQLNANPYDESNQWSFIRVERNIKTNFMARGHMLTCLLFVALFGAMTVLRRYT